MRPSQLGRTEDGWEEKGGKKRWREEGQGGRNENRGAEKTMEERVQKLVGTFVEQ